MQEINKMIFIAPYSQNVIKVILNLEVANICKCYLIGDKKRIEDEIKLQGFKTDKLNIWNANDNEMEKTFHEIKEKYKIKAFVFDCISQVRQKKFITSETDENEIHILFHPLHKKLYFVSYMCEQMKNNKRSILLDTKEVMEKLSIHQFAIGIIAKEKDPLTDVEKKILKKVLHVKKVDCIDVEDIFKSKCNLLIFKDQALCSLFLDLIAIYYPIQCACIKKASNEYYMDAYGIDFKDLFFSSNLINKILLHQLEIDSQAS